MQSNDHNLGNNYKNALVILDNMAELVKKLEQILNGEKPLLYSKQIPAAFQLMLDLTVARGQGDSVFRMLEGNPALFRPGPYTGLDAVWEVRKRWIEIVKKTSELCAKIDLSQSDFEQRTDRLIMNTEVGPMPSYSAIRANATALVSDAVTHFASRSQLDWRNIQFGAVPTASTSRELDLSFAINTVAESGIFDDSYYISQLKDSDYFECSPVEHYIRYGSARGLDPNPLFSVEFYRFNNPNIETDPLVDYIVNGSRAMQDPHPLFLTDYYLKQRGAEVTNRTWLSEFLATNDHKTETTPLFDVSYYAKQVGLEDVGYAASLVHFIVKGCHRGCSPTPLFDIKHYESQIILSQDMSAFLHYVTFGWRLGLSPHPLFNPAHYLGQAIEEFRGVSDPLTHYLIKGEEAGATPCLFFDPEFYSSTYSTMIQSRRGALIHYLTKGAAMDHSPSLRFDATAFRKNFPIEDVHPKVGALEDFLQWGFRKVHTIELIDESATASGKRTQTELLPGRPTGIPLALKERTKYKELEGNRPAARDFPNVLLVAHAASDHLFGSERSFLDMLDGLRVLDVNIIVALPQDAANYTAEVIKSCSLVVIFKYPWWRDGEMTSPDALAMFSQIIIRNRIDVVHVNTIMLRECLDAARAQYVPSIVHVRELITGDETLTKVIGESADRIATEVLRRADWIIANSEATASIFYKPGCTFVIPNTVNLHEFEIENKRSEGILRFGLISSNIPKKGLVDVVELAKVCKDECPNARFLLIGPITDAVKGLLDQQSRGELPNNLEFPGYAMTPSHAIAQVNVVLSFSHFAESFGRTALEAMAAGRPVIAYDHGALPELVRHGVTGFLIPYKNPLAALDFVKRFSKDPELVDTLGEHGRIIARQWYGMGSYQAKFKNAYSVILPEAMAPRDNYEMLVPDGVPIIRPARLTSIKDVRAVSRIAYFCWHFPVPSETFVLNEIKELLRLNVDVIVFCRQIPFKDFDPGFKLKYEQVVSPEALAKRLVETARTIVHAHFVYPTVTDMVWPACQLAKLPFTFIAHAQDIFKYDNDRRNRLAEIGASPLCVAMFTLSKFHLNFVVARGFPRRKVIINPNAVDVTQFLAANIEGRSYRKFRRIVAVHRYVPKKGIELLLKAASLIKDLNLSIDLYGYGELETEYRRIVADLGLTNVNINGAISQGQVVDVMRGADLFACPAVRIVDTGDMDGLPTSIIEGMAAGVPILTTSVGALPELIVDGVTGVVASPDVEGVADAIRRFYAMPAAQVASIIAAAKERVSSRHDVRKLVRVLLRVWQNRTIDILIVSWNNLAELRTVVEHVVENTSLPFHLIICDNRSAREPVPQYLEALWRREDRVTVIHNDRNAMVGPGTNQALAQGVSDYAVYMCGREGVSFVRGWEIPFVHHFAENEDCGLNGSIGHSPTYLTGADYPKGISIFDRFRNKTFAHENESRVFGHVQGGLFGIRREMAASIGGFSDDVPHDYTDVEYSFYAESKGWQLGNVPGVLALFNKSRPSLSQRFDESVVVAHPVLLGELGTFRKIHGGSLAHCNVCNWFGGSFDLSDACPTCASSREDRSLYRWLSESQLMYRRLPALAVGLTGVMNRVWAEQFQGPRLTIEGFVEDLVLKGRLPNRDRGFRVVVVRPCGIDENQLGLIASEIRRTVGGGVAVLLQPSLCEVELGIECIVKSLPEAFEAVGLSRVAEHRYFSQSLRYAFQPIIEFARFEDQRENEGDR